jgi:hypothetical protein
LLHYNLDPINKPLLKTTKKFAELSHEQVVRLCKRKVLNFFQAFKKLYSSLVLSI